MGKKDRLKRSPNSSSSKPKLSINELKHFVAAVRCSEGQEHDQDESSGDDDFVPKEGSSFKSLQDSNELTRGKRPSIPNVRQEQHFVSSTSVTEGPREDSKDSFVLSQASVRKEEGLDDDQAARATTSNLRRLQSKLEIFKTQYGERNAKIDDEAHVCKAQLKDQRIAIGSVNIGEEVFEPSVTGVELNDSYNSTFFDPSDARATNSKRFVAMVGHAPNVEPAYGQDKVLGRDKAGVTCKEETKPIGSYVADQAQPHVQHTSFEDPNGLSNKLASQGKAFSLAAQAVGDPCASTNEHVGASTNEHVVGAHTSMPLQKAAVSVDRSHMLRADQETASSVCSIVSSFSLSHAVGPMVPDFNSVMEEAFEQPCPRGFIRTLSSQDGLYKLAAGPIRPSHPFAGLDATSTESKLAAGGTSNENMTLPTLFSHAQAAHDEVFTNSNTTKAGRTCVQLSKGAAGESPFAAGDLIGSFGAKVPTHVNNIPLSSISCNEQPAFSLYGNSNGHVEAPNRVNNIRRNDDTKSTHYCAINSGLGPRSVPHSLSKDVSALPAQSFVAGSLVSCDSLTSRVLPIGLDGPGGLFSPNKELIGGSHRATLSSCDKKHDISIQKGLVGPPLDVTASHIEANLDPLTEKQCCDGGVAFSLASPEEYCGSHAEANAPVKSTWAGLFKTPSHVSQHAHLDPSSSRQNPKQISLFQASNTEVHTPPFDLEFVDHQERVADLVLKIPKELTVAGKEEWSTTLVGRFLGKKLPFSLVTKVTDQFWASEGLIDTLATDSGCFFFTFSGEATRDAVLEGGPWFVAGQPLLLSPWKPHYSFQKEEVHTVPIWVNFYGIPLEYWNPKGISFISSFIGKPIRVDRTTASRRRITYARVCIEVDAQFDFFNEFHIETEDEMTGESIRNLITLEYQWTPLRCSQCSLFGHDCSKSPISNPRSNPVYKPHKKTGKDEGVWQVVTNKAKDKGIKIADPSSEANISHWGKTSKESVSHRPKDIAPITRSNKFEALAQDTGARDSEHNQIESKVPFLVRGECSEANASHHTIDVFDEAREGPNCSGQVDDVNYVYECEDAYGLDGECGPSSLGSPMSNRQRKREAKMKFSGSRPKDRH